MRTVWIGLAWVLSLAGGTVARGQFEPKDQPPGIRLDKQLTQRWQVGVKIKNLSGPCGGMTGYVPVPADWPEQQVRIDEEDIAPLVRNVQYRDFDGVKLMQFSVPNLPAGAIVNVLVTFEVTRSSILPPERPAEFTFAKTPPRDVRPYLGPGPGIDPRQTQIRNQVKEIVSTAQGDWQQVQAIYDWVRDNVKFENGKFKGELKALQDKAGCRDDLTSLFIALCRAQGVPARTVWVMDNCYAEFYLEDAKQQGCWFPCQVAGVKEFGGMSDHRPIMQKGENFKLPGSKEPQRFVAESLTGSGRGGGRPQVEFVRNLMPAK